MDEMDLYQLVEGWTTHRRLCGVSGGQTVGAGHVCRCVRRLHPDRAAHGCECGGAWRLCPDCGLPNPGQACFRCGYDWTEDGFPATATEAVMAG